MRALVVLVAFLAGGSRAAEKEAPRRLALLVPAELAAGQLDQLPDPLGLLGPGAEPGMERQLVEAPAALGERQASELLKDRVLDERVEGRFEGHDHADGSGGDLGAERHAIGLGRADQLEHSTPVLGTVVQLGHRDRQRRLLEHC